MWISMGFFNVFSVAEMAFGACDVGEWLGAAGTSTFNFPPGVRPVLLEIHMHGLDIHNFEARMQVRQSFIIVGQWLCVV
jgi:pre-mRNA-splicing helicase BRR2